MYEHKFDFEALTQTMSYKRDKHFSFQVFQKVLLEVIGGNFLQKLVVKNPNRPHLFRLTWTWKNPSRPVHYENKFTKTFRPTDILHIFTKL